MRREWKVKQGLVSDCHELCFEVGNCFKKGFVSGFFDFLVQRIKLLERVTGTSALSGFLFNELDDSQWIIFTISMKKGLFGRKEIPIKSYYPGFLFVL